MVNQTALPPLAISTTPCEVVTAATSVMPRPVVAWSPYCR
jgi:hypothetical protein